MREPRTVVEDAGDPGMARSPHPRGRNHAFGVAVGAALVATVACRPAREPSLPPTIEAGPATHDPPTDTASSPEREAALFELQRMGVIGASLSAGYGDGVALHQMLDAGLLAPHAIFDASSSGLFMRPTDIAAVEIGVMRLRSVRLVVAVDFLFWFAYGDKSDAARHTDLELGLTMLDELRVPVFVGDLPDVHGASPQMISPHQIPDRAVLDALNARITAWAERRASVHVLPMAAWTDALRAGAPPRIEGVAIAPGDALLQWDGLHPTARGQAVLVALVLSHLREARPGLVPRDVVADPDAVLARYRAAQGWDRLPEPPNGAARRGAAELRQANAHPGAM